MALFLCYDIRGIQSFIFKIPRLRYIVGGSAIVDKFDRETMKNLSSNGCERIYSAGGKGAFVCETEEQAQVLKEMIITEADKVGLDIRFGMGSDFSKAALNTDEVYPFFLDDLEGEPCSASGLYPVKNGGEHDKVLIRRNNKGHDRRICG